MRLWTAAEAEGVRVFAANLRDLLLAAPAGARVTMGLDPGYRSGVKVAVVDATGKVVATTAVYPHEPQRQWDEALATLGKLAVAHRVDLIAIGNGTASRETDKLATELVKLLPDLKMSKIVVSEAGARSIPPRPSRPRNCRNSTSPCAARCRSRGACRIRWPNSSRSTRRRSAWPVPARPRRNQTARSLDAVVEDCVNAVGVDANTASAPLLARVSGIGAGLAQASCSIATPTAVQIAQGAEGRAAARTESVRAMRRLPAHQWRRRPARSVRRASGSLSGGAADTHRSQERHQGADRQCRDRAPVEAAGLSSTTRLVCPR